MIDIKDEVLVPLRGFLFIYEGITMTTKKLAKFSSPLGDFFLYTPESIRKITYHVTVLVPLRGFLFIYPVSLIS